MIESVAYELIKEEGRLEGRQGSAREGAVVAVEDHAGGIRVAIVPGAVGIV